MVVTIMVATIMVATILVAASHVPPPQTTGSMIVNIAGCVNRNLLQCPLLVLFPLQQYLSPKSNRLLGPEPGLLYCYTVILVIQSLVW